MLRLSALVLMLFVAGFGSPGINAQEVPVTVDKNNPLMRLKKMKRDPGLIRQDKEGALEVPPKDSGLKLIQYPTEIGKMNAYLSVDPEDNKKHPMVIWVFGGFSNGIGSTAWEKATKDNDQSASIFRKKGILMMYPSFRGGLGNPGVKESFFGEVFDLIKAVEYAKSLPYVDPNRVYLGGHSTGGTMVLLAAVHGINVRGIFSFGPAYAAGAYGQERVVFDVEDQVQWNFRSPTLFLKDIKSPTFVMEGEDGNSYSLSKMQKENKNKLAKFYLIPESDHFNILAPVNDLIAEKILADQGNKPNIKISKKELVARLKAATSSK